jgi:hypothetical protein
MKQDGRVDCGETLPQSATKVGVLVRLHGDGDDANNLGWIRCLPSKKRSDYQVRYTNGGSGTVYRSMVGCGWVVSIES